MEKYHMDSESHYGGRIAFQNAMVSFITSRPQACKGKTAIIQSPEHSSPNEHARASSLVFVPSRRNDNLMPVLYSIL